MGESLSLHFVPMSERREAIEEVARWWTDAWGLPTRHRFFDDYLQELASLQPGELPMHLLALHDGRVVGVATLKDQSALHDRFPEFRHWLSGVFVPRAWRGRGIATALCRRIVEIARARGIERVYLNTETSEGGLYARIGWHPLQRIELDGVDLLVMVNPAPDPPTPAR